MITATDGETRQVLVKKDEDLETTEVTPVGAGGP
jgi:hypothetical protein